MSETQETDIRISQPSSICTTGLTPNVATGVVLQLLREHFSSSSNIMDDKLKDCIWVPKDNNKIVEDEALSKIMIEPHYKWNPNVAQKRPAILIKRGAWQPQIVAIGLNKYQGFNASDMPDMGETHMYPITGSHSIRAVSTDGSTAELLATELLFSTLIFAPVLQDEFGFSKLHIEQLGELEKLDESSEHYAVQLQLSYVVFFEWTRIMIAPRFKGVSIVTSEGE